MATRKSHDDSSPSGPHDPPADDRGGAASESRHGQHPTGQDHTGQDHTGHASKGHHEGLTLDMLSQAFAEAIAGNAAVAAAAGSPGGNSDAAEGGAADRADSPPAGDVAGRATSADVDAKRSTVAVERAAVREVDGADASAEVCGAADSSRSPGARPTRRSTIDRAGDDAMAPPPTPLQIVEAILFVGHPQDEPITSRLIASLLRGVDPHEVDEYIRALNEAYRADNSPYEIALVDGGYRMCLRGEFLPLRDRFYGKVREARLSQPAIDLLAIVAYHQPITRDQVQQLRPGGNSRILNQLLRRELLQLQPNPEDKRRPFFVTTERFLALFGIDSLDALPRSDDLSAPS